MAAIRLATVPIPMLLATLERPPAPPPFVPGLGLGSPCWKGTTTVYSTENADKAAIRVYGKFVTFSPSPARVKSQATRACEIIRREERRKRRISCGEPVVALLAHSPHETNECAGAFFFALDGPRVRQLL